MVDTRPAPPGGDDIHLWNVDLAPLRHRADTLYRELSGDEKARADRYVFPERRAVYVIVRCMLRRVLAGYLARDPSALRFELGPYGKPQLTDGRPLAFNVSHSGDKAVIAVTREREVGVDLEHSGADLSFLGIAATMFSPFENRVLHDLHDPRERAARFFTYWTRREAFVKALGTGLAVHDIRHLDFATARRFATAPFDGARDPRSGRRPRCAHIIVRDVASFPGYSAAVAFETDASCCNVFSYALADVAQAFA